MSLLRFDRLERICLSCAYVDKVSVFLQGRFRCCSRQGQLRLSRCACFLYQTLPCPLEVTRLSVKVVFAGNRLRVEISHGRARDRHGDRGGHGGYDRPPRGGYDGGGGYGGGGGRRGPHPGELNDVLERSRNKGSAYRAIVKGLPASASWQDLKVCSAPF